MSLQMQFSTHIFQQGKCAGDDPGAGERAGAQEHGRMAEGRDGRISPADAGFENGRKGP